jgi:hypothetical protein
MKQRIPRTMKEAVEDTIKLHELALSEGVPYIMLKCEHNYTCPLCLFSNTFTESEYCVYCPWYILEDTFCNISDTFDYRNNVQSIIRLKDWLNRLEENS